MKICKKIKIGILEIGAFSAVATKVYVFEADIFGFNEKNMGFYLTPKKCTPSGWALGD